MKGKGVEEPQKDKPRENLNTNADEIVLISDDEDDVVEVTTEQKAETKGSAVKEECLQAKHIKRDEGHQDARFYTSDALLLFIRRYCSNGVDCDQGSQVSDVLSPTHPLDIIRACCRVPYCLYLYVGVELGERQSTSVILIGYHDQSSGMDVVRLLCTLQMSVDSNPQTSEDMDTDDTGAQHTETDARRLIDTLKTLGLPLSNLVVFYCNAPHPVVSQVFESQLEEFSPRLVSLCGLPGIAGRALQAGLVVFSRCVVDLVTGIHRYCSTCSSINDSLKELFADAETHDPSLPLSAQCLFLINTVQKMISGWRDLVLYFKSVRGTQAADHIRTQLMDPKVKLHFLFLSHAFEPLRTLQELQQHGAVDVATELQLTCSLVTSYTSSVIRPAVTDLFLKTLDVHVLDNEKELLPPTQVNIGPHAKEFLWATAVVDLGEQARLDFFKDAAAFYKATLQSLLKSIPQHLGDMALININKILKYPENISVSRFLSVPHSETLRSQL